MGRNSGPPSMNESDLWPFPCSGQDSAAAAGSFLFSDGDDVMFPDLCLPADFHEPYQDNPFFSKATDEHEELNGHAVQCQSSEINNSYRETTVNNEGASRPDASIDPQNFSNSMEMDNSEKTSQPASRPSSSIGGQSISLELHNSHVKIKVKLPEFFVEVPATASVGFLKKAILEKATAMIGRAGHLDVLLPGENTGDENEFIPKSGTSHQNKLDGILVPEHLQDSNGSSPKPSGIPLLPQPQTWCTPSTSVVRKGTTDTSPDSFMSLLGTTFQDNQERLEFRTNVPIADSISSMTAITCSKVNGSLNLVPKSQNVKAFKSKKHLVMDENSLDVAPAPQKSKSSKNEKRRKTETASFSSLKEAMREKETKMVVPLCQWENTRNVNGFIPKVGTSHQNKLDDGCISSMTTTTCSKVVPKKLIVNLKVANKENLPMDVNSLDVGPAPQKSKSSKNEKPRKIEPFSIPEVEALVQKIEEHGTGRWAMIKDQAFGQNSKRTRGALRDKWERLLKTAKMSPEKRRGPKIPQEILDRVMAIDKCNSQH